jgi:hypothetical protein
LWAICVFFQNCPKKTIFAQSCHPDWLLANWSSLTTGCLLRFAILLTVLLAPMLLQEITKNNELFHDQLF